MSHQQAVDDLLGLQESVRALCPPEIAAELQQDISDLRNWCARIAIIGQVKAGKSSLLGTLIGRPGFLPREVNPWTSVVTNIHIGCPDLPTSGGVFHFFDEAAWDRILNGDRNTRDLAERLLPGFRPEVLEQQVRSMQRHARERLGKYYDLLLGQSHAYDEITPEILERYVCAGPRASSRRP